MSFARISRIFVVGAALAAALLCAAPLAAAPARPQGLQHALPPQPLADALETFARSVKIQLVYGPEITQGLKSKGAPAGRSIADTLRELLRDTGLTFEFVNESTVTILRPNKTPAMSDADIASGINLAQADKGEKSTANVEEMVVEGERDKPAAFTTANLDLTRTEDDVLPFTVFTARDIELSGAANVEEFLRNRLPQFVSDTITEEVNATSGDPRSSQNTVNMRGWGSGTGNAAAETVILINGRRLPGRFTASDGDTAMIQGDFRGVPLGAIERIEVLTSAGSAIYGGNATGGVVNIILRQDYRGGQLAVNYENPWKGYAPRRSIDLNYGQPLMWGVGLRLTAGVSESVPLKVEDRADRTTLRWVRLALQRDPARIMSPMPGNPLNTYSFPGARATPNIMTAASTVTSNLFGNGTPNFTSVPSGYTGGQGIQPFLGRQGVYNFDLADGAQDSTYGRFATLGTKGGSTSVTVALDKSFGPKWRVSLEHRYSRSESQGEGLYGPGTLTVPAAAPTNPFGQDVIVTFDDPRMERPEIKKGTINSNYTTSATLRGEIRGWRMFFDASYSRDEGIWNYRTFYAPVGGWRAAFLSGAYNPFVDMRVVAPAAASLYETFVMRRGGGDSASNNRQAAVRASGTLFNLPSGAVLLTGGVDWSRQARTGGRWRFQWENTGTGALVPFIAGDPSRPGNIDTPTTPINILYTFESYSGYAETTVPLIAPDWNLPLARKLEVFASTRQSYSPRSGFRSTGEQIRYSDRSFTNAYGFRYELMEAAALRVSRSVGFRPPSMGQVTPATSPPTTNVELTDPRRGNQAVTLLPTQYITGGNPDLKPMTTASTNFGVIFQPIWLGDSRFSVDYVESVRDDVITSIAPQLLVDLESDFPERVTRAAPEPGAPNGVGMLQFIDARSINFRQMISKSVDFSLDHRAGSFGGGRMSFVLAASKLLSFKVQTTNTSAPEEQVRSRTAAYSRATQWSANAQLRWERGPMSVGWSTRYLSDVLAQPTYYVLQGADRAPWALDHDVSISYRTGQAGVGRMLGGLLADTSTTFGIKNVLDREPRFWAADSSRGVAPGDSIVGRSLWLQVRKSFQ